MTTRTGPIRRSRLATKRTALILIMALAAGGALYRTIAPFLREPGAKASQPEAQEPPQRGPYPIELLKVVDGDTLKVRRAGVQEYVRLLRTNTPEKGEPGYREATQTLEELIRERPLRLEPETGSDLERDRYGRLLAYVFAGDRNLSLAMVESGWTRFYTRFGKGKYAAQLEAAQAAAKEKGLGLWAKGFARPGDKRPR
ncbi:MAG: thermonuclease family protein [Myxococcota bacterium]|jgi:micrococcal nuclease|nr:thermonuclease family protein [Myxococcota bacterium]